MAEETPLPRASRFKEGTMNSTLSIHPPPDYVYLELDMEDMIERADAEDVESATHRNVAAVAYPTPSASASPSVASSHHIFGRFSRAVTSFFSGNSFSGLGKRKADQITEKKDDRKAAAEKAYQEAKELGLLPEPKIFNRPIAKARKPTTSSPASTPVRPLRTSPSKKDLQKQEKLSRKVSDLEHKLAEAKRELSLALNSELSTPVMPPLPPTPSSSSHVWATDEVNPAESTRRNRVVKKRKATGSSDGEYKAISAEEESEDGSKSTPASSVVKKKRVKRSGRLTKKKSTIMKENVVTVVPDGVTVPPLPSIPRGVEGNRVAVGDDGFGGLGHEIF